MSFSGPRTRNSSAKAFRRQRSNIVLVRAIDSSRLFARRDDPCLLIQDGQNGFHARSVPRSDKKREVALGDVGDGRMQSLLKCRGDQGPETSMRWFPPPLRRGGSGRQAPQEPLAERPARVGPRPALARDPGAEPVHDQGDGSSCTNNGSTGSALMNRAPARLLSAPILGGQPDWSGTRTG